MEGGLRGASHGKGHGRIEGLREGVTSCTMLPHSVSQACSTSGDPTCSRHLSPDLLEGAGGTGGLKWGEPGLESSEKRLKRLLKAWLLFCLARMSTRLDSQCRPKTTRKATGMFSHSSLLVSAGHPQRLQA